MRTNDTIEKEIILVKELKEVEEEEVGTRDGQMKQHT